jgi:hypothetical protein
MTRILAGIALIVFAAILGLDTGDDAGARTALPDAAVTQDTVPAVRTAPTRDLAPALEAEEALQEALSEAYRAEAARLQPFVPASAAAEAAARILVLKMDGLRGDAAGFASEAAPLSPPMALGPVASDRAAAARARLVAALDLNRTLGFADTAILDLARAQAAFDCHTLIDGIPAVESAAAACGARFDAAMDALAAHLTMHAAALSAAGGRSLEGTGPAVSAETDPGNGALKAAAPRLDAAVYRVRPVAAPAIRGA